MINETTIQRLRQNAVSLIARDQSVKTLANIVAEMCLIAERQQREITELRSQIGSLTTDSKSE